jgi:SAM-dependent methyltransferase
MSLAADALFVIASPVVLRPKVAKASNSYHSYQNRMRPNMFPDLLARITRRILSRWPRLYSSRLMQRFYWNLLAGHVHTHWGECRGDWDVIARVIDGAGAKRVLDVGCGSGRHFPLYERLGVEEIVGQDIALSSLRLAANRAHGKHIRLTHCPIAQLPYAAGHFDLAVSNRVLQHVPPEQIAPFIGALCKLTRYVYINELSDTDNHAAVSENVVMHEHHYEPLFAAHGFGMVDSGMLAKQWWRVFARSDSASAYSPRQAKAA